MNEHRCGTCANLSRQYYDDGCGSLHITGVCLITDEEVSLDEYCDDYVQEEY